MNNHQVEGKEFLSIREVAGRLNIHEMTVYRLIKARNLPAFKVGGQWRIRSRFLDTWIEEKTVPPEKEG